MEINGKQYWGILTPRPASQILEFAKQAESMGMEGLWGIQFPGPPFSPLATAAAGSGQLKLGTGVTLAFTRSPLETAVSALDLDIISGGRMILGLGPGMQFVNERWHGVPYHPTLARLREATTIIRLVIERGHTGKLGQWRGKYYDVDFAGFNHLPTPVRPRIPIYLGAMYLGAVRLAAEIADGLVGHPVWPVDWVREEIVPALTAALTRAGKARKDFHLNTWTYISINKDRRQAIEEARGTLALYAGMGQFRKHFSAQGFGEVADRVKAAAEDTDEYAPSAKMVAAISDAAVERLVVVGTPDEVRRKIDSLWEVSDSVTLLVPFFLTPEQTRAQQEAIAETLY